MFRFAFRLIVLTGLIIGSVAVLAAPDETDAVANAGWEEMGVGSASGGGISGSGDVYGSPSVAIGPDNMPVLAWADGSSGDHEIYVKRWDGSAWVEVGVGSASGGGISNNAGSSEEPAVAIGPDGVPVVAWVDNSLDDFEIYLRRWNGSAWVELAGSASFGGLSNNTNGSGGPSVAIGNDLMPIVAWSNEAAGLFNRDIYVRRWNGSAWVEMGAGSASGGGISNNEGIDRSPSVAIGPDGAPIIAWSYDGPGCCLDIYAKRWNGSSWVEMGGSASNGGISNDSNGSIEPSLALDSNGAAIVAWRNNLIYPDTDIYVRRWNGTTWAEMGQGSATQGGISNNSGISEEPSLAIGPDGAPVVVWHDDSGGDWEVYARRWNGATWVEIDDGAATGGGISNDNGNSMHPSLAIGPNNTSVVIWADFDGNTEVHSRRYQPCSPSWYNLREQEAAFITATNWVFLPTVVHILQSHFAGPLELEPNNNTLQANGPICSGYNYAGLPDDRYDVFTLEADRGLIAAELADHAGTGVQFQLHHQTITPNPIAIDVNGADGYRINLPNAPAGRYYIVISTATPDPDATTHYQLTTTFNMSR